jgi:bla regulator protein blaR1
MLVLAFAMGVMAQDQTFEVASIKPNNTGDRAPAKFQAEHGRLTAINVPVGALIINAYQLNGFQISGGPDRLIDRYDVVAKAENDASREELMLMLQNLLKDRFKLVLDRQVRQMQGYVLTGGKLGANLKEAEEDEQFALGSIPLVGKAVPMSQLVRFLSSLLRGPVEDQTGLTGRYNFRVEWRPDPQTPPGPAGPGFYDPLLFAMRDQLGIKIETKKVPVEVFTVKHLERPSEN